MTEIRRPYRVLKVSAQALITQGSPNAAGMQVRILDQSSKGVAASPHTLLGYTPRTVTVHAPPDLPFVSPQALIANQNLVAVDAMCYGAAVKFPVMLTVSIQVQRMEEAVDACVVYARVLEPDGSTRRGSTDGPSTSAVAVEHVPLNVEQGLAVDGLCEVGLDALSLADSESASFELLENDSGQAGES